MASTLPDDKTADEDDVKYWCHTCRGQTIPTFTDDGDMQCPTCHDCFIEVIEEGENPEDFEPVGSDDDADTKDAERKMPHPHSMNMPPWLRSLFPANMGNASNVHYQVFNGSPFGGLFNMFGNNGNNAQNQRPRAAVDFDQILHSMMRMVPNGGNLAAHPGDYAGGNIQDIINRLFTNDPNRHGTPPTDTNVIDSLPDVKPAHDDDKEACAVCKDTFEDDELVKELPCKHHFHTDCIVPWLKMHSSCPVCRARLPTGS